MKVLWISDGGVSTGFSRATHGIADRLVTQHGHEVSILAANYRGDWVDTPCHLYVPTTINPKDVHGQSRIIELLAKIEPDVVVLLNDPFVLANIIFNNTWDTEHMLLKVAPLVTYQPRDGYNPPATWDALREVAVTLPDGKQKKIPVSRQVAMSKFGQDQMPGSDLVYHGVDTEVFHPASVENPIILSTGARITSKAEAKEAFGFKANQFLILRVDRNSARKDFAATWKAITPVMHHYPNVMAQFHCSGADFMGGVTMPALWTKDLETASRFKLSDRMDTYDNWDVNDLVALNCAADVTVSTSQGEGFGLALAESLACAVPVVAQSVSAITEVVGPGGILIEPGYEVTAPGGQDMYAANIPAFTSAIEDLYRNAEKRKTLGVLGMEHVRKTFDWDTEAAKFNAILEDVTGIYGRAAA